MSEESFIYFKRYLSYILLVTLLGCAHNNEPVDSSINRSHSEMSASSDRLDGFNRVMWDFNYNVVDPYFFRPISIAYSDYTPRFIHTGISNFLANLDEPASMVNNFIMGNEHVAVLHLNRFFVNSTVGLLGLFDVASATGVKKYESKSFSDAIGHYGVGDGAFFMLPFYGPVTLRQTAGLLDGLYMPLSYLNLWQKTGKWAVEGMDDRVEFISQEPMIESSPDSYLLIKDVYLQNQAYRAEIEPELDDGDLEDYFDEID